MLLRRSLVCEGGGGPVAYEMHFSSNPTRELDRSFGEVQQDFLLS
jgi:hypothetical protein